MTRKQVIDQVLFLYGSLIVFVVTYISFLNLNTKTGLIAFILLLPVSIYFIIRSFFAINFLFHRLLNHDLPKHHYFGTFKLRLFFDQSDPFFHLTLTLFSLAFSLTLVRISLSLLK